MPKKKVIGEIGWRQRALEILAKGIPDAGATMRQKPVEYNVELIRAANVARYGPCIDQSVSGVDSADARILAEGLDCIFGGTSRQDRLKREAHEARLAAAESRFRKLIDADYRNRRRRNTRSRKGASRRG